MFDLLRQEVDIKLRKQSRMYTRYVIAMLCLFERNPPEAIDKLEESKRRLEYKKLIWS